MKKILNLLLVRRPESKDKWWNRLALVLIYGSTVVVGICFALLIISDLSGNLVDKTYTAYSFEQNYQTVEGKEVDCNFWVSDFKDLPQTSIIYCGDLSSHSEFLDMYTKSQGTYGNLQEIREQRSFSDAATGKTKNSLQGYDRERAKAYVQEKAEGKKSTEEVDEEILAQLIQGGELDDVKVKRVLSFDYALFFGSLGIYLVIMLGWIIFWESIVYRTILFIIYGRNRKS